MFRNDFSETPAHLTAHDINYGGTHMPSTTSRRSFLKTASAGAATMAVTATSYARIVGANERISIGLIGCGGRGCAGTHAGRPRTRQGAERRVHRRERPVADPARARRPSCQEWYGRPARQFVSYRDILALEDVDAVMIASCDHQHATHLEAAAKAKKDAYCEKPLAMDMESLKTALRRGQEPAASSCQIGHPGPQLRHQHRLPGTVPLRRDRQGLADRAVPQRHASPIGTRWMQRAEAESRRTWTGRSS